MTKAVELAQVASNGVSEMFKNRIINGAMVIDQRNAGASVTPSNNQFITDRWKINYSGNFTCQQNAGSVTPPAGFSNYLGATATGTNSPTGATTYSFVHIIEGYNIADLNWGSADAKTVTLSFWVRSSATGTFGGSLQNSNSTRSLPFSYTIASANTWELKTIALPGDTTGTWLTTNGAGIALTLCMGGGASYQGTANVWAGADYRTVAGQTNALASSGGTFYITGVQLEVGSSATGFEYRQYGQELALCQRYYERFDAGGVSGSYASWGTGYSSGTSGPVSFKFAVNKRASPTISQGGSIRVFGYAAVGTSWTANDNYFGTTGGYTNSTWTSSITTGYATIVGANGDSTAYVAFSAEL